MLGDIFFLKKIIFQEAENPISALSCVLKSLCLSERFHYQRSFFLAILRLAQILIHFNLPNKAKTMIENIMHLVKFQKSFPKIDIDYNLLWIFLCSYFFYLDSCWSYAIFTITWKFYLCTIYDCMYKSKYEWFVYIWIEVLLFFSLLLLLILSISFWIVLHS